MFLNMRYCLINFPAIFAIIYVLISKRSNCDKPSSPVKKIPNIMWKIFDDYNRTFWFARKKHIVCPTQSGELKKCNIYLSWEDHPVNIDAYIIYGTAFYKFPELRDPKVLWGLLYEESARANPFILNEKFLNLFNFSATYSRYSDAPFPLLYLLPRPARLKKDMQKKTEVSEGITSKRYYVNTKIKNWYLKEIAPVLYLQSNSITFIDRDNYVLKLMEYIPVDSCGKNINNRKLPKELTQLENEKATLIEVEPFWNYTARYKFQIAIESSVCNDYVTEKLWRPIVQGVVPIYFGSPTIRDWLPNKKSAILIEDFATPELLAEYLRELLNNDTKYEEHLEHKTKGMITNQKLIDEFKSRPKQSSFVDNVSRFQCFLCQKLHEEQRLTSKVNVVTRKALDCKMPYSVFTHSLNPKSAFLADIYRELDTVDSVYDKYMNREPVARAPSLWGRLSYSSIPVKREILKLIDNDTRENLSVGL